MKLTQQQLKNLHRNNGVKFKALAHACVDCNLLWHPLVMTFDHRDRSKKVNYIPKLLIDDPAIFDAEIAKCDVVCWNCHQIREYLRDLNILNIGDLKRDQYRFYERLVPYLCGGAILRNDAYKFVPAIGPR